MDVLTFFGSVWLSIAVGIFAIAMIVSCTYDRHFVESPKWYVFVIGMVVILGLIFKDSGGISEMWQAFKSSHVWNYAIYYLIAGLLYSGIEFMLEVRRSARFWSVKWEEFKKNNLTNFRKEAGAINEKQAGTVDMIDVYVTNKLVGSFLTLYGREWTWNKRIIVVDDTLDEQGNHTGIVPRVNRVQLAASIGCWTVWWPFYAISLIIGDLFAEIFRFIADCVASMSGRFVRFAFRDVFKF